MFRDNPVTHAIARGPRASQEDRYIYLPLSLEGKYEGHFFGVMDGHGGVAVAEYCVGHIEKNFFLENPGQAEGVLQKLILDLDEGTRDFSCGSTITLACIFESHDKATFAVLGDSPTITIDNKGEAHVGPLHNVRTNARERRLAEERGGTYQNEYVWNKEKSCGLQMSRVLGDKEMGAIVSREPEIYTIDAPRWVCLATDGLIDVVESSSFEMTEKIIEMGKRNVNAHDLMALAERNILVDNTTIFVWQSH